MPCTRHDGPLGKTSQFAAFAFLTDAYLILKLNFGRGYPRLVYSFQMLNHSLIQNSRAQLTKRRMRTFITRPKAKNTKAVADPP